MVFDSACLHEMNFWLNCIMYTQVVFLEFVHDNMKVFKSANGKLQNCFYAGNYF